MYCQHLLAFKLFVYSLQRLESLLESLSPWHHTLFCSSGHLYVVVISAALGTTHTLNSRRLLEDYLHLQPYSALGYIHNHASSSHSLDWLHKSVSEKVSCYFHSNAI